jgi:hypothetical protein
MSHGKSNLICDKCPQSRSHERRSLENEMRTILVALSLVTLATHSFAAQSRPSIEKMCRELVGREEPEATDGKAIWASSMCNALATA